MGRKWSNWRESPARWRALTKKLRTTRISQKIRKPIFLMMTTSAKGYTSMSSSSTNSWRSRKGISIVLLTLSKLRKNL
jgi:zona occludens toxin (predicted ATPase)